MVSLAKRKKQSKSVLRTGCGRRRDEGLQQGYHAGQPPLDVCILGLDGLFGAQGGLEVLIWLLRGQILDLALQGLNLVLSPFTDGALCLAI